MWVQIFKLTIKIGYGSDPKGPVTIENKNQIASVDYFTKLYKSIPQKTNKIKSQKLKWITKT